MNYPWISGYLKGMPYITHDYKAEWGAERFMIAEKMFAMIGTDKEGRPIITLKTDYDAAVILRETYSDIIPGYYMNKNNWNSVYLEGSVPDDVMRDMIDKAHALIFGALTKKVQKAFLEGEI